MLSVPVEGWGFRYVDELDLAKLLLRERDPVETISVLVNERPERAGLDRDQAHWTRRTRQPDDGARNQTSQIERHLALAPERRAWRVRTLMA